MDKLSVMCLFLLRNKKGSPNDISIEIKPWQKLSVKHPFIPHISLFGTQKPCANYLSYKRWYDGRKNVSLIILQSCHPGCASQTAPSSSLSALWEDDTTKFDCIITSACMTGLGQNRGGCYSSPLPGSRASLNTPPPPGGVVLKAEEFGLAGKRLLDDAPQFDIRAGGRGVRPPLCALQLLV